MSLLVRVFAPTGRDGELIAAVLEQNGIATQVGKLSPSVFVDPEHEPIGPLLIAEEALTPELVGQLQGLIRNQPPWSDLPLLLLTTPERQTNRVERLGLGFPILLERPIRPMTLVSSVRAALRARVRQYEIRDTVSMLKGERETLQAVLDHLPLGVVLAKASGEILLTNRRLEQILRHPTLPTANVEAHGRWVSFHPDGSRVRGEEYPLPRAMQSGHPIPPEEYLYQRGDTTKAWVSIAAAPILDERGVVTGGVAVISDIEQQKRSEAALIQSEKLAAVGRLAASISHEINNPLEAVTNLLYLARQDATAPEEVRTFLNLADQELGRVSQIVSHTLRFHRQSTRPRAVSAQELLEPTLGLYAARLSNSHVQLQQRLRSTNLVMCYEGEIRQVLNNLVGNAIEAMKNGGRLFVRTRNAHSWRTGERGLRITVADTGHGMTPDTARQIFEPFFTTKGLNGTGLGLWISRGIVSKHNGQLQVRSSMTAAHHGTVFSMYLPCEPREPLQPDGVPDLA